MDQKILVAASQRYFSNCAHTGRSQTKCNAAQIVGAEKEPVGTWALFVGVPETASLAAAILSEDPIWTHPNRKEQAASQLAG